MVEIALVKESEVDPGKVAVVTATLYPSWYQGHPHEPLTADKLRGDLALQTLAAAKATGFRIALVDGGSSQLFHQALEGLGINFEKEESSLGLGQGSSRRQALEIARAIPGVEVLCQTEPEKVHFVANSLISLSAPILREEADIVVPQRDQESFATYPKYQARTEIRANRLYNKILRKYGLLLDNSPDIDFWFGVRLLANKPEIVDEFERVFLLTYYDPEDTIDHLLSSVRPDAYSNPLFFPVLTALEKGIRIKSVPIHYEHPENQTRFEEGNDEFDRKRDFQRRIIIRELIYLLRILMNRPSLFHTLTNAPKFKGTITIDESVFRARDKETAEMAKWERVTREILERMLENSEEEV